MNRKRVAVIGVCTLAVLVGLAFFVPRLLTGYVEAALQKQFASLGVEATWSSFSGSFGRTFVVERLMVRDARRGISAEVEHVEVSFSVVSLTDKTFRLDALEIQGARVDYNLSETQGSDEGVVSVGSKRNVRDALQRFILDLPDVVIRDGVLRIARSGMPIFEASTRETTLELGWESAQAGGDLRVSVVNASLHQWIRPIDGAFTAKMDLATGAFDGAITHSNENEPLIFWDSPELGALEVGNVSITGNVAAQTGSAKLERVSVRLGSAAVPALSIETPRLFAEYSGRPRLRLEDAKVEVTPSKRGIIRELIQQLGLSEKESGPSRNHKGRGGKILRGLKDVTRLLEKADFEFSGVQVSLNLESDADDAFTKLTLLEDLDGQATAGHVRADGRTAGGTFHGEADFLPGEEIPRFVYLNVDRVNLDKIPGMPRGRSELPNRGTSGRIGGVLSVNLFWQMPLEGHGLAPLYTSTHGTFALDWKEAVVDLVGVSEEPLTDISFSTKADFEWRPNLNDVRIRNGRLDWGAVDISFEAAASDFPLDSRFEVKAKMAKVDCQRAFRSVPAGMLGPYRHIELEGEWEPSFEFFLPVNRPRDLKLEFEGYQDVCIPTALNVPKPLRPEFVEIRSSSPTGEHTSVLPVDIEGPVLADVTWLNRPFVKRVTEGVSSEEVEIFVGPGTSAYVPLQQMPVWVGGAAFLSEEMMFYSDAGVSIGLITKALRLNLEKGRFVYGGSTVTQQLVKNLFLTRDKTLSRKLQEALVSWRITQLISKDRVLELYLNCIEFGPDVYGIGPAARFYFQKDARDLSPLESVFLAMLKPSPLYGARVIQRRRTPDGVWWTNRTNEMFQRLLDRGMITPEQAESEKPYVLEWDDAGQYIDRKKSKFPSLSPSLP